MKKLKVVWTDSALSELDNIYQYFISNIGVAVAQNLINNIFDRSFAQLELFPQSGAIERQLTDSKIEYRYLVIGHYKIIYKINDQLVYITKIFDCRLDPQKLKKHLE